MLCVWASHTYYKSFNPRVNTGLALLLYVCVAHTHEPNPSYIGLQQRRKLTTTNIELNNQN